MNRMPMFFPDPKAESDWTTFENIRRENGYPPLEGKTRDDLKRVFFFSAFVSGNLARRPDLFENLHGTGDVYRAYDDGVYRVFLKNDLSDIRDEAGLIDVLSQRRLREMTRIAIRDLAGWARLEETMRELSDLADACIDGALDVLHRQRVEQDGGAPIGAKSGRPQALVVIALGKLGARELNFSSDVDLLFAYPEAGFTRGGRSPIPNEEFFTKLCRRVLKVFAESRAFRVDLRLRPFGENGPLVMSFDAMEEYYLTQGREWERYALIKARISAGDREAGEQLMQRLTPFVFRRYLDYGAFESLREMKRMIAQEARRKLLKNNIKTGPGGIREIEFFGQIFQLIRGGLNPSLQAPGIVKTMELLVIEDLVPATVAGQLREAYVFLRRTENRLQAYEDRQTHDLPPDRNSRERLAASMGFETAESFMKCLDSHMRTVHQHFNDLLSNSERQSQDNGTEGAAGCLWDTLSDSSSSGDALLRLGFRSVDEALNLLRDLKSDSEARKISLEARRRLARLIPHLLQRAAATGQPETVLKRLIDLLKAILRRSSYISLLIENPSTLDHLARLAHESSWIIARIARHPMLLDELLDHRALYTPPDRGEMERNVRKKLDRTDDEDLETQMDVLRIFKQANMLRVAAADIHKAYPLMKVSDYLTYIAEVVLGETMNLAWNHLVRKHGAPECMLEGVACDRGFCVIAYGKLGGIELGYGSDLDLVFLHGGTPGVTRGGEKPTENVQFFSRMGQRMVHIMTAHTAMGALYEADMRLRPSGVSGMLVSHAEAFREYQLKDAWTWEHQAIVRARPICGDPAVSAHFNETRRMVLIRPRDRKDLRDQIVRMRSRMRSEKLVREAGRFDLKQGFGGLVDIEFLVQYLVLAEASGHPELVRWTDNVRLLETLKDAHVLESEDARLLHDAWLTFRSEVHRLDLREEPAQIADDRYPDLKAHVIVMWERLLGDMDVREP